MLSKKELDSYVESAKKIRGNLKEVRFNGLEDVLTTQQIAMLESIKSDSPLLSRTACGFISDIKEFFKKKTLLDISIHSTKEFYGSDSKGRVYYIEVLKNGIDFHLFDKGLDEATQMISLRTNDKATSAIPGLTPDNIYYEKIDKRGHKACYYFLKDDKKDGHYRVAATAHRDFDKSTNISK